MLLYFGFIYMYVLSVWHYDFDNTQHIQYFYHSPSGCVFQLLSYRSLNLGKEKQDIKCNRHTPSPDLTVRCVTRQGFSELQTSDDVPDYWTDQSSASYRLQQSGIFVYICGAGGDEPFTVFLWCLNTFVCGWTSDFVSSRLPSYSKLNSGCFKVGQDCSV